MHNAHPTLHWKDLFGTPVSSGQLWRTDRSLYFFMKGRGAAFQALTSLRYGKGGEVLLPSFHCPSVVEPVLRAGYRPRFYAINRNLSINVPSILQQVSRNTAALVIVNYCGFPTDREALNMIRNSVGCCLIEDWAHSFLQASPVRLAGSVGDLVLYSFNKLLPTYCGGGLLVNNPEVLGSLNCLKPLRLQEGLIALKRLAEEVVENMDNASIRSFLLGVERFRVSLKRLHHSGTPMDGPGLPTSPINSPNHFFETKIPWFAKVILERSDLESVAERRRRNYTIINRIFVETEQVKRVFSSLPENVCPWAYPLLVERRERYDRVLRSLGVPVYTFGETLHPLVYESQRHIREDARYLSQSLLLIPIHQNLSGETVASFADTINAVFASNGAGRKMSALV